MQAAATAARTRPPIERCYRRIGRICRLFRRKRGLSTNELAFKLGWSGKSIVQLETFSPGGGRIGLHELPALAAALQVEVKLFLSKQFVSRPNIKRAYPRAAVFAYLNAHPDALGIDVVANVRGRRAYIFEMVRQWRSLTPEQRVLPFEDPRSHVGFRNQYRFRHELREDVFAYLSQYPAATIDEVFDRVGGKHTYVHQFVIEFRKEHSSMSTKLQDKREQFEPGDPVWVGGHGHVPRRAVVHTVERTSARVQYDGRGPYHRVFMKNLTPASDEPTIKPAVLPEKNGNLQLLPPKPRSTASSVPSAGEPTLQPATSTVPAQRLSAWLRTWRERRDWTIGYLAKRAGQALPEFRIGQVELGKTAAEDDELVALATVLESVEEPGTDWLTRLIVMREADLAVGMRFRKHKFKQGIKRPGRSKEPPAPKALAAEPAVEVVAAPPPSKSQPEANIARVKLTVGGVQVEGSADDVRALLGIK